VQARLTYTVPEVAELLGISRSSAYECVRRGEIPALTLGRRVVIAKAAIDALLGVAAPELHVPAVTENRR
jgi:excisionase family DNA binding protein